MSSPQFAPGVQPSRLDLGNCAASSSGTSFRALIPQEHASANWKPDLPRGPPGSCLLPLETRRVPDTGTSPTAPSRTTRSLATASMREHGGGETTFSGPHASLESHCQRSHAWSPGAPRPATDWAVSTHQAACVCKEA